MSMRARWTVIPLLVLALAGALVATVIVVNRPQPETIAFTWPETPTMTKRPDPCANGVTKPFTPTRINIENVGRNITMVAMPRDANNVPMPPPNDDPSTVAWDRPPGGIAPGSSQGKSILSAHTWPDNSALGNKMLMKFKVGDLFVLSNGKQHLCYRVTKQVHLDEFTVPPGFYARDGKHQIVFMVCSGTRLGPGHWSHRETWYASPVSSSR